MIRVRQIKVDVRSNDIIGSLARKLHINKDDVLSFNIIKRSIDARHKDNVCFIYELDVVLKDSVKVRFSDDVFKSVDNSYSFQLLVVFHVVVQ